MICPSRARQVARGVVSVFVRHLSAVFLLLGLLVAQGARAEATFTNVVVTPASGMVDGATGKLSVTVSGRVKAIGTADAIRTVALYYDNQSVQNRQYTVRYTVAERPINDERSFSFVVPVDPGSHTIQLGAFPDLAGVGYTPVYTVAATGLTNGAQVSAHAALPATVTAGQTYNVAVTMVNTGTTTWTTSGDKPYSLGSVGDNGVWNVGRVGIAGSVAPGAAYQFNFTVTAPAQPGTYNYRWQMVQDGAEWFGAMTDAPLTVTVVAATAPPTAAITGPAAGAVFSGTRGGSAPVTVSGSGAAASGAAITSLDVLDNGVVVHSVNAASVNQALWMSAGATHAIQIRANDNKGKSTLSAARNITVLINDASFVSAQNVPGTMLPGATTNVSVTMKNTGTSTWTAGTSYLLGAQKPQDNTTWRASNRVTLPASVAPGGQQTFSFDIKAPAVNGSYGFQWQMVQEFVGWFGAMSPDTTIAVATQAPTVALTSPAGGGNYVAAGASAAVPVTGTATGAGSATISKIELLDNGVVVPAVATSGGAFSASVALAPGTHSLQLRATDTLNQTATSASRSVTVQTATAGNGARFVSQIVPATMRSGQPYTVTVTMQNTGTTTWTAGTGYRLGVQNPQDNHAWVFNGRAYLSAPVVTGGLAVFTIPVTAPSPAATYNFQWKMVQENVMWFGEQSANLAIPVSVGPGPAASLTATPTNVRVSGTQAAPVSFSAKGVAASGTITKLELFQGTEITGFSTTATQTFTGSAATLSWNPTVSLPAGVYMFKLRATDAANVATETAAVMVNVTNSALLGLVSGVATRADKNYLLGWTCQSGAAAGLNYQLLLDAPSFAAGATLLETGVANVATEANNAAVQSQCATPGAAHNFVIDLSPYIQYAGRQLYVRASNAAGTSTITLPCADNNCAVPGALRVGISTPAPGAIFYLPNPAFLRMVVAGASKPLDEVAFSVNGTWIAAKAEADAPGAYSVSTQLAASTTPYTVQAKVRQGNITLFSVQNQFTVSGAAAGAVTITAPSGPTTVNAGATVAFSASVNGSPASVKFFANTAQIGAATASSGYWNYNWVPNTGGTYSVVARAYDAAGVQLGASTAVTVTVNASPPSSATPLPVAITPPHLSNADAGTLPGGLSVGNDGAATYDVPIAVPPGTGGMTPALSLRYSSGGPNGMAGLGWSLTGLSTIHRCPKTIAQDGTPGRINFDTADRLCLDGQRLVRVNGGAGGDVDAPYWEVGAEFRTELDSFTRITRLAGGAYKVENKDGRVRYFGTNVDGSDTGSTIRSVGRADSQPLVWALGYTEDRVGNYMAVDYRQDGATGEYVPTQVRYGGNRAVNQATDLAVRFDYEARGDTSVMYIGGARNDLVSRLTHVRTYTGTAANGSGGALVKDHEIHYTESATSGRSLVDWMQACATNPVSGALECLPKTSFDWGQGGALALRPLDVPAVLLPVVSASTPTAGFDYPSRYQGNLDGSGRTSFIANRLLSCEKNQGCLEATKPIVPNTLRIRLPNGVEFDHVLDIASAGFAPKATIELRLADMNGDGRDDLVLIASSADNWGYCLNEALADGTVGFRCLPGPAGAVQSLVDLRNESKMHVLLVDRRAATFQFSDCSYVNNAMQCVPLPVASIPSAIGAMPALAGSAGVQLSGIELSKQSFSDFISAWTANVPAADPAHGYRMCDSAGACKLIDVSIGAAACFYRQNGLACQAVYNKIIPGDRAYSFTCTAGICTQTRLPAVSSGQYVGDLNGDGLTDFIFLESVTLTSSYVPITTVDPASPHVCFSKEAGADCRLEPMLATALLPRIETYVGPSSVTGQIADFLGDGVPRLLARTDNTSAGKFKLCRYSRGFVCQAFEPAIPIDVPQMVFLDDSGVPAFLTNCDKFQSQANRKPCTAMTLALPPGTDKLTGVTNGLGYREEVDYARGSDAAVYKRVATIDGAERRPVYPQRVATPGVMVKQVRRANGRGNWLRFDHAYEGALSDAQGRGSLGFAKAEMTDQQSGIRTSMVLSQDYPTVGMVLGARSVSRANVVLSDTVNVPATRTLTAPSGARTFFPYIDTSTVTRRDLDSAELGTTVTRDEYEGSVYDDFLGNVNQQTVGVTGGGRSFTTRTVTTYANDRSGWLIGRPSTVTVTKTGDGASVTRSVAYDYQPTTGLLTTMTVERGNAPYELVTVYGRARNSFGLVNTTTQSWKAWTGMPAGTSLQRQVSDIDYDAKGRFALTVKNAVGHAETRAHYAGTGAPMRVTDPNGLTTSWETDGFGRVTVERRPDGNETRHYRKQCGGCAGVAVSAEIADVFHGADRIGVPTVVYSDAAGHKVQTSTWGFDGRRIDAGLRYDDAGRLFETDQPHFDGEAASLASRQFYDDLGRISRLESAAEGNATLVATTSYSGYTTTSINPKSQKRIETRDALGQLRKVEQVVTVAGRTNTVTGFDYEPFGNLGKTVDPNGNVIVVSYDKLGRKTDLTDPDLGWIHYDVDPLGQVWRQINPVQRYKGQSTAMSFDALGRMVARAEPDLTSRWVFDQPAGAAAGACVAGKSCGQLIEAYTEAGGRKDYRRVIGYDALGRAASTEQTIGDGTRDAIFRATTAWDAWGRVVNQSFQLNTETKKVFDSRYNDKGYLARLERGGQVLWRVATQDAAQRATQTVLGNGLTQDREYNPYTGRLDRANLRAASAARLQESYVYDSLGNVKTRGQYWDVGGFMEMFDYDELNRLTSAGVNGAPGQVYDYDNAGNIRSKTNAGTGAYVYPLQGGPAKTPQGTQSNPPHGVASIPGIGAFGYDLNGNLLSGAGRTYTWNSFDMPKRITLGTSIWSEFVYGPEHQRTRQSRSDGSAEVYAGAQVTETTAAGVTVKTYWPYGVGMEIDQPGGGTSLNWIHTDRLGSVMGITDEAGALKEKLAYDAWGKRRTLNGLPLNGSATPSNIDGVVDNRGFTGHEMLDQLDLVHMNGRVFDPLTARFLSGDPLVQDPRNGQNYNRYSYVFNNPTNLTDPTGFATADEADERTKQERKEVERKSGCEGVVSCITNLFNKLTESDKGKAATRATPASTPSRVGDASGGPNPCAGKADCVSVPGKRQGYDRNDVRGGFDERGNSLVYNPRFYNPAAASKVLLLGVFNAATFGMPIAQAIRPAQVFYRAMSAEHYAQLVETGQLAATGETFISPTLEFAQGYEGVVVQFTMKRGAQDAIRSLGVRDASLLTETSHGTMSLVEKGWAGSNAFFKAEQGQINIGLGNGKALETFNRYMEAFAPVK